MKAATCLVTSEAHFNSDAAGVYSDDCATYSFWSRYLEIFDGLIVLARARPAQVRGVQKQRADGPAVSFCMLPDFSGPWQYLTVRAEVKAVVRDAVRRCDAYILRAPGVLAQCVWHELKRLDKGYALEVLGDPWDALGPGTWPSLLRPMFRRLAKHQMKKICGEALVINYVTRHSLQRRYPPAKDAYATSFSDVLVDTSLANPELLERRCRRIDQIRTKHGAPDDALRIGYIGTFARLYKGPDVLLRALSLCRQRGLDFQMEMVGQGRYLAQMKGLARQLGIEDRVRFAGQIPSGCSISDFLDGIDLFVMPSRTEGLPRALVEAMSRGCPCLASSVGGIPELLASADTIPANDPGRLAQAILEVAQDTGRLKEMALRNLQTANTQFRSEILGETRRDFLRNVKLRVSRSHREFYVL